MCSTSSLEPVPALRRSDARVGGHGQIMADPRVIAAILGHIDTRAAGASPVSKPRHGPLLV